MRTVNPLGSEAPLSKVHRNDIYKLDGVAGLRAVTWHDVEHQVVWFLGATNHDYKEFENRAANSELLPLASDYEVLAESHDVDWLQDEIKLGLEAMIKEAQTRPGQLVDANLAGVVCAEILVAAASSRPRLHLRFRVPPLKSGVLGSGFHYLLLLQALDVDEATIRLNDFPDEVIAGALSISAEIR